MKKRTVLQSLICLLAVSCSVKELDITNSRDVIAPEREVFYASLESYSDPDTKVYLDEDIKIRWNADDRISIFNKSTLNQQFTFAGKDGENYGEFHWVEDDLFGAGNDLGYICAVYPFRESTTISNSGVLTLTLPAEQTYEANSFGLKANTMIATSNDNLLKFKNVGGYLGFQLYGTGSVKSIILAGKNGERLAGEATVTPVLGQDPEIQMSQTAKTSIVLTCDTPVELGTEPKIFWMVVPPVFFEQGFTLTVTAPNGNVFIKETSQTAQVSIERNTVLRIAPLEVDLAFTNNNFKLTGITPVNENTKYRTDIDQTNRTATVTMPTITDFSNLLFNYTIQNGNQMMVNGITLVNGETPIDASEEASLVVRSGQYGKVYKLTTKNTGLPVVRIDTKGKFTLAQLEEYKNALQNNGVDERIWLPESGLITVRIEDYDGTPGMKTKDGVPIYETDTQIKGRGNYSWKWEKKPYALKFDSKTEVLGMPAHKRWVLLANWRDRTLLRNDATFWLAKKAQDELPYTTRGQFVELEFNGDYRGNYYLCEQIKIDENRVNITSIDDNATDPTGGFLMEIDSYWDEVNKFKSAYFDLRYMFKDPDEDADALEADGKIELATNYRAAYDWMEDYINRFEKVVKTKSAVEAGQYTNYLDIDSAIMFMLLNELVGNGDFFQTSNDEVFGPHSTYLYKNKGENAKLYMGPLWDFDYLTFTPNTKWRGFDSYQYYYYYLCHNQNFVNRIKYLWSLYKTDFAGLSNYIEVMKGKLSESQKFDEAKWPYNSQYDQTTQKNRNDNKDYGLSYEAAITRMKDSFEDRHGWLDNQIEDLVITEPAEEGYYKWINGKRVWVIEWQFL